MTSPASLLFPLPSFAFHGKAARRSLDAGPARKFTPSSKNHSVIFSQRGTPFSVTRLVLYSIFYLPSSIFYIPNSTAGGNL